MTHYLAFVFDDGGGFGFSCPDIPGFAAESEAEDFDAAVAEATRILAAHAAALIDTGHDLPAARDLAVLRADEDLAEDWEEAATTVMLPALVPAGRTKRVNVTIDEHTLAILDRAAEVRGITRSAAIAEASRQFAGVQLPGAMLKRDFDRITDEIARASRPELAVQTLFERMSMIARQGAGDGMIDIDPNDPLGLKAAARIVKENRKASTDG